VKQRRHAMLSASEVNQAANGDRVNDAHRPHSSADTTKPDSYILPVGRAGVDRLALLSQVHGPFSEAFLSDCGLRPGITVMDRRMRNGNDERQKGGYLWIERKRQTRAYRHHQSLANTVVVLQLEWSKRNDYGDDV